MQELTFIEDGRERCVRLPDPEVELLPGVPWGDLCALFTPAYWYTQFLMNPLDRTQTRHRIGTTFEEELTVCLLGGYGIPAEIGLAAFERLKSEGLIAALCTNPNILANRLREPIQISGRRVQYRFWRQKAEYLASAYRELRKHPFPIDDALALREKLLILPGIGPKTASWIVRNWLDSNEVAILDIHVVRAGILAQLFAPDASVSKDYMMMESKFVAFCTALDVRTADLDALIWRTMRTTPRLVKRLLEQQSMIHALKQNSSSSPAMPSPSRMS